MATITLEQVQNQLKETEQQIENLMSARLQLMGMKQVLEMQAAEASAKEKAEHVCDDTCNHEEAAEVSE